MSGMEPEPSVGLSIIVECVEVHVNCEYVAGIMWKQENEFIDR
jgi:hypothetical protein